jgi:hypothetical protein
LAAAIGVASLVACSDDHGHDEATPDAEACEHLQEGPALALTAGAAPASAPAVDDDHRRYDISLVDIDGGKGGVVRFAAAEAGAHLVVLSADVAIRFVDGAGSVIAPLAEAKGSASCGEVAARFEVPFVVGTVYLEIGPTAATSVNLVVEAIGAPAP